ncbi:MAG: hypothetical protein FJ012_09635 [Chloroflexi bacterium]|nr:hypothetical protein [Chloroflexota bacterium]
MDDYVACLTKVFGALLLGAGVIVVAVGAVHGAIGPIVVGVVGLGLGSYLLVTSFVKRRPQ